MTPSVAVTTAEKKCTKCGGPGPFNRGKSRCKTCTGAANTAWRLANPEKARQNSKRKLERNPEKYRELNRKYSFAWQRAHPEWALHRAAKCRARMNELPFDLRREDVIIPARCPLLGMPLVRADGHVRPDSPTLDRIVPSRGYVKGNVWVISHRANLMKQDATREELSNFAFNILNAIQDGIL